TGTRHPALSRRILKGDHSTLTFLLRGATQQLMQRGLVHRIELVLRGVVACTAQRSLHHGTAAHGHEQREQRAPRFPPQHDIPLPPFSVPEPAHSLLPLRPLAKPGSVPQVATPENARTHAGFPD